MADPNLEQILEVNKRQKDFYNTNAYEGWASRLWGKLRDKVLSSFRDASQLKEMVYGKHKEWLGDLTHKKVLDLGCLEGNYLSYYIAEHAKSYTGIDLSEKAIAKLDEKLKAKGIYGARVEAVDFLSPEFSESGFDVIYAYSVLHHFPNLEMLVARLKEKLNPGGIIIAYDPTETSWPVKLARMAYRPFQNDKDWEWPFTRKTFDYLSSQFQVREIHGILGSAKYSFLYNWLPFGDTWKQTKLTQAMKKDWDAPFLSRQQLKCMHITMLMQNGTKVD